MSKRFHGVFWDEGLLDMGLTLRRLLRAHSAFCGTLERCRPGTMKQATPRGLREAKRRGSEAFRMTHKAAFIITWPTRNFICQ